MTTSGTNSGVVLVTTTLAASGDELRGVAKSLVAKDADLWGPAASSEAAARLGWLDLPESSQALLPQLRALHERFSAAGLDHVVLCAGQDPVNALRAELAAKGIDATLIGGAERAEEIDALRAMEQGMKLAYAL